MYGHIENKIYYKIEDESQLLRLGGGSWTINLKEISGQNIEKIEYITPKRTYFITLSDAMKKGFVRNFQGELKLIVPLRAWGIKEK